MDSAIGSTPNLDDDAANNPSEAAIVKQLCGGDRRSDDCGGECQSLQSLAGAERAENFNLWYSHNVGLFGTVGVVSDLDRVAQAIEQLLGRRFHDLGVLVLGSIKLILMQR